MQNDERMALVGRLEMLRAQLQRMITGTAFLEDGYIRVKDPHWLAEQIDAAISALTVEALDSAADDYAGYSFADLKERRIATDRGQLSRKIKDDGFPPPVKLGDSRQSAAWWRRSEVHAWLDARANRRKKIAAGADG